MITATFNLETTLKVAQINAEINGTSSWPLDTNATQQLTVEGDIVEIYDGEL